MQSIVNLKFLILTVFLAGQVICITARPQEDDAVNEMHEVYRVEKMEGMYGNEDEGVDGIDEMEEADKFEREEDTYLGSVVQENQEDMARAMVQNSDLDKMTDTMEIEPLAVEDIVSVKTTVAQDGVKGFKSVDTRSEYDSADQTDYVEE